MINNEFKEEAERKTKKEKKEEEKHFNTEQEGRDILRNRTLNTIIRLIYLTLFHLLLLL